MSMVNGQRSTFNRDSSLIIDNISHCRRRQSSCRLSSIFTQQMPSLITCQRTTASFSSMDGSILALGVRHLLRALSWPILWLRHSWFSDPTDSDTAALYAQLEATRQRNGVPYPITGEGSFAPGHIWIHKFGRWLWRSDARHLTFQKFSGLIVLLRTVLHCSNTMLSLKGRHMRGSSETRNSWRHPSTSSALEPSHDQGNETGHCRSSRCRRLRHAFHPIGHVRPGQRTLKFASRCGCASNMMYTVPIHVCSLRSNGQVLPSWETVDRNVSQSSSNPKLEMATLGRFFVVCSWSRLRHVHRWISLSRNVSSGVTPKFCKNVLLYFIW